jgi:phage baseplate assembly protein W
VAQIREDLAAEREASVRTAVEQERARWEARLEQELKQARMRSEAERQVSFGFQGRQKSKQACIVNM